jgi:hypothetical protein
MLAKIRTCGLSIRKPKLLSYSNTKYMGRGQPSNKGNT